MSTDNSAVEVTGPLRDGYTDILSDDALGFVTSLAREFAPRVTELMALRDTRQQRIDDGEMPGFLDETRAIRDGDWRVTSVPDDLTDRRVEITGPTERKMIINALNSGAKVFMADCEDSLTPTWDNIVQGQVNLRDAAHRTIEFDSNGKHYALNDDIATLIGPPETDCKTVLP